MLIRGDKLTAEQKRDVLAAFVHRNTVEKPFPLAGGPGTLTDEQWLSRLSFHFSSDDELILRRGAMPAWFAD